MDAQPRGYAKRLARHWDHRSNVLYQKFHKIELLINESMSQWMKHN